MASTPHVNSFHKLMVRFPAIVMTVTFALSAGLASLAIANNAFDALGSWSDFSSIIVRRQQGFGIARMHWHMLLEDHDRWDVIDHPENDDRRRRLSQKPSNDPRRLAETANLEINLEITGENASWAFADDGDFGPDALRSAVLTIIGNKFEGFVGDSQNRWSNENRVGYTCRLTVTQPEYEGMGYDDGAWSFMESMKNKLTSAHEDGSFDDAISAQCGGCRAGVDNLDFNDWTDWQEDRCAQQTSIFETWSLVLMFKDDTGKPLSAKTLNSIMKAQVDVSKIKEYQAQCLRHTEDSPDAGECVVASSPVNLVAAFLGSEASDEPLDWDNVTIKGVAQCLNIDAEEFARSASSACLDRIGSAPRCSANDKAFAIPEDPEVYLPMFRAMCVNGSGSGEGGGEEGGCGDILRTTSDALFGNGFHSNCRAPSSDRAALASRDARATKYTRVFLPAGTPLDGSGNCDGWNYEDEMFDNALMMIDPLFEVGKKLEENNPNMKFYFTWIGDNPFFDYYLEKDLLMLSLSFALVFIVLWIQTSSLFITFAGMYEIVISFPLGLYVWNVLMNEPGVTYLMYNGIFIILGIGCDDIFVFIDAFRQSKLQPIEISGSLETRFAWAYNRAALAMLATSVTTTLAFAACSVSEVWDIRCFGIVNGFMVLFDYLLVITWFPAACIFHEKYLADCMPWCTPQGFFKALRCSKGNAQVARENEGHFLETFFGGRFAEFVLRYAKLIICVSLVAVAASTAVWVTGLKPASEPFTFFNDEHWYSKMQVLQTEKFAYESIDGKVMVELSFGLDKSDPWDPNGVHPTVIDEELYETTPQRANFDQNFDMFAAQQQFMTACEAFHEAMVDVGEASRESRYWCWMQDFAKWARSAGMQFPIAEKTLFNVAVEQWINGESGYGFSYDNRTVATYEDRTGEDLSYGELTGFAKKDDEVIFTFATFETSLEVLEDGHPNKRMWKLYDNMQDALQKAQDVSGLSGGIQTCGEYGLMALGTYLEKSAMVNVGFSLAIAVVVIFAVTMNYWLTLIATLCLYAVISLVFAEMVIFGWTINILEAVCMSIAGGMSVDYVLHMCHSYNHLPGDAPSKVREALEEMGVSVTSGAITTFCACISLFLCDMLWFRLFGCFIAMIVITAFIVSLVTLMALLAVVGPGEGKGYIYCRRNRNTVENEDSSAGASGGGKGEYEMKYVSRGGLL